MVEVLLQTPHTEAKNAHKDIETQFDAIVSQSEYDPDQEVSLHPNASISFTHGTDNLPDDLPLTETGADRIVRRDFTDVGTYGDPENPEDFGVGKHFSTENNNIVQPPLYARAAGDVARPKDAEDFLRNENFLADPKTKGRAEKYPSQLLTRRPSDEQIAAWTAESYDKYHERLKSTIISQLQTREGQIIHIDYHDTGNHTHDLVQDEQGNVKHTETGKPLRVMLQRSDNMDKYAGTDEEYYDDGTTPRRDDWINRTIYSDLKGAGTNPGVLDQFVHNVQEGYRKLLDSEFDATITTMDSNGQQRIEELVDVYPDATDEQLRHMIEDGRAEAYSFAEKHNFTSIEQNTKYQGGHVTRTYAKMKQRWLTAKESELQQEADDLGVDVATLREWGNRINVIQVEAPRERFNWTPDQTILSEGAAIEAHVLSYALAKTVAEINSQ